MFQQQKNSFLSSETYKILWKRSLEYQGLFLMRWLSNKADQFFFTDRKFLGLLGSAMVPSWDSKQKLPSNCRLFCLKLVIWPVISYFYRNLNTFYGNVKITAKWLMRSCTIKILPYVNFYCVRSDRTFIRSYEITIQQNWNIIV